MSNWQTGNRALCIDKSANTHWKTGAPMEGGVQYGIVYIVSDVSNEHGRIWLAFPERQREQWDATSFRKLVPLCDRADVGQEVSIPSTVPSYPIGR